MKKNALNEFKLWTVFLAVGTVVLATEVAVKATRTAEIPDAAVADVTSMVSEYTASGSARLLPEELAANLLVESVVQIESGGRPRTVGSRGERGLMQIMETTWAEVTGKLFGRSVPFQRAFEPELNRQVGTAYLSELHRFVLANRTRWQADERSLLLACYNAGPNRVAKSGFNLKRLPASTQDYVSRACALHDVMLEEHAMKLERANARGLMQIVQLPGKSGS